MQPYFTAWVGWAVRSIDVETEMLCSSKIPNEQLSGEITALLGLLAIMHPAIRNLD